MEDAIKMLQEQSSEGARAYHKVSEDTLDWVISLLSDLRGESSDERRKLLQAATLHVGGDFVTQAILANKILPQLAGIANEKKFKNDPFATLIIPTLATAKFLSGLRQVQEAREAN